MQITFYEAEAAIVLTYSGRLPVEDLADNAYYLSQFLPPIEVSINSPVDRGEEQSIRITGEKRLTLSDAEKLAVMLGEKISIVQDANKKKQRNGFCFSL